MDEIEKKIKESGDSSGEKYINMMAKNIEASRKMMAQQPPGSEAHAMEELAKEKLVQEIPEMVKEIARLQESVRYKDSMLRLCVVEVEKMKKIDLEDKHRREKANEELRMKLEKVMGELKNVEAEKKVLAKTVKNLEKKVVAVNSQSGVGNSSTVTSSTVTSSTVSTNTVSTNTVSTNTVSTNTVEITGVNVGTMVAMDAQDLQDEVGRLTARIESMRECNRDKSDNVRLEETIKTLREEKEKLEAEKRDVVLPLLKNKNARINSLLQAVAKRHETIKVLNDEIKWRREDANKQTGFMCDSSTGTCYKIFKNVVEVPGTWATGGCYHCGTCTSVQITCQACSHGTSFNQGYKYVDLGLNP
jgi:TolA-binding protein